MIRSFFIFVGGGLIGISLGSGVGGWAVAGLLLLGGALRLHRVLKEGSHQETNDYQHPATGRFCHICGADGHAGERCDSGLHS